ncbi:hypothetical protein FRC12_000701 [Ceratobasidium sp. 428]|nr:hypothetical protein FRC12_000701 [Ceratobasidium sp. 428]
MSLPPEPGTYWIYSCVRNEMDQKLAMTFNGEAKPITVTPLEVSNSAQRVSIISVPAGPREVCLLTFLKFIKWIIENYHELQCVIPGSQKDLKANYGQTINTTGGDGHPCWIISPENNGYIIQDGKKSYFWGIESAADGTSASV